MIENPEIGTPVVYLHGNGIVGQGTIVDLDDEGDVAFVESNKLAHCEMLEGLFHMDDHDGVVAALNDQIENCKWMIDVTQRKKREGKPVMDPPAQTVSQV